QVQAVEHGSRLADAQVVDPRERCIRYRQRIGVRYRGLVLVRPVGGEGRLHGIGGEPQQLAADDLQILAAVGVVGVGPRLGIGRLRIDHVGNLGLGRARRIGNHSLVTVAYLRRYGDAREQSVADRHVRGEGEIAAVESSRVRFGDEVRLAARRVGHDTDRASYGVRAEERALRTLQDLDAIHIEEVLIGADGAREIDAVQVDADARIQVERKVILTDAADG